MGMTKRIALRPATGSPIRETAGHQPTPPGKPVSELAVRHQIMNILPPPGRPAVNILAAGLSL
jgi:hypothetical protein